MTMPAGWKNTSTKMTLFQYVKNIQQTGLSFLQLSFEPKLALTGIVLYQGGIQNESSVGASPPGYTPTGYNFLTGERMLETQVQERQEVMSKARYYAYTADDMYKTSSNLPALMSMRGYFALAYVLLWKLYRIAPHIYDLPLCMEECLNKLASTGPIGPKDILRAATSQVQVVGQDIARELKDPQFLPMSNKILLEYSQQEG